MRITSTGELRGDRCLVPMPIPRLYDNVPGCACFMFDSKRLRAAASRYVWVLPLLAAVALFLWNALRQLNLPGFYYDEALDLVPMLAVLHGEHAELLRGIGIGRLPVMLLDYMGSLGGYITTPFLLLFGSTVTAGRVQPISGSVLTLILMFALTRRWFGLWVASFAALLLAVQPSFVWFSRQGISVTSIMTVFAWASLLLLTQSTPQGALRLQHGRLPLLLGGVVLGLGLWAKLPFLWWLMMLMVMACVYVFARRRAGDNWSAILPSANHAALLVLGFCSGAAPLIYYNVAGLIRDGMPHTLALILGSLLRPTQQFGVDNLDFARNLSTSWTNFTVYIDGSYFWYNGVTFGNTLALPALALALMSGAVLAFGRPERWRWLACALALPVAIVMGSFTVSGQWATHFFIISGLPQILLACAAVWLGERVLRSGRLLRHGRHKALAAVALTALLLAAPFARDVWVNEQHHFTLAKTGGSGRFSDAVYSVARYLDQQHAAQPIALDWGIEKQIRLLTDDRVRPLEIFGYTPEPDDAFRARARELLRDPSRSYIVLWDRFAVYNRRAEFTRLANEMGLNVTETHVAHERSGLPVYVVLQAR